MQSSLKTLSFLFIIALGFSCHHEEPDVPPGRIDRRAIEQFISLVDMGVEALANNPPRDPLSATDILVAKTPEFQARIGMDLQLGKRGRGSSAGREPLESGTT